MSKLNESRERSKGTLYIFDERKRGQYQVRQQLLIKFQYSANHFPLAFNL